MRPEALNPASQLKRGQSPHDCQPDCEADEGVASPVAMAPGSGPRAIDIRGDHERLVKAEQHCAYHGASENDESPQSPCSEMRRIHHKPCFSCSKNSSSTAPSGWLCLSCSTCRARRLIWGSAGECCRRGRSCSATPGCVAVTRTTALLWAFRIPLPVLATHEPPVADPGFQSRRNINELDQVGREPDHLARCELDGVGKVGILIADHLDAGYRRGREPQAHSFKVGIANGSCFQRGDDSNAVSEGDAALRHSGILTDPV
jgi:hypothetical protein